MEMIDDANKRSAVQPSRSDDLRSFFVPSFIARRTRPKSGWSPLEPTDVRTALSSDLQDLRRDWRRWRAAERLGATAIALAAIAAPVAICLTTPPV
jgi:hypothetical protein